MAEYCKLPGDVTNDNAKTQSLCTNFAKTDRAFNKKVADKNNKINNMSEDRLVAILKYSNLDTRGTVDILRKRLKLYTQKHMALENSGQPIEHPKSIYSYFLIIDFEATCEEPNPPDYQHEIIEFPVVLYDVVLMRTVDTFHAYCQPQINKTLSEFCGSLTNINQETVDTAQLFPEVLRQMEDWMTKHRLYEHSFAVVSDCNADMAKFMRLQCEISGIAVPEWARQWINLHRAFRNFYQVSMDQKLNLQEMLNCLGLQFEGQQHSGLDDARNILRIAETLLKDCCDLRVNEKLDHNSPQHNYSVSVTRQEAESGFSAGFCGGRGDKSSSETSPLWHHTVAADGSTQEDHSSEK